MFANCGNVPMVFRFGTGGCGTPYIDIDCNLRHTITVSVVSFVDVFPAITSLFVFVLKTLQNNLESRQMLNSSTRRITTQDDNITQLFESLF